MSDHDRPKRRFRFVIFALVAVALVVGGAVLSFWLPWHREQLIIAEIEIAGGGTAIDKYIGPNWEWLRSRVSKRATAMPGSIQRLCYDPFFRTTVVDFHVSACGSVRDEFVDKELFEHIASLKHLTRLSFDGDLVSDEALELIGELRSLESLQIHGDRFDDARLSNLRVPNTLRSLSLQSTNITDAGLQHLASFTSLRHLDLSSSKINGEGLVSLRTLKRLNSLSLAQTKITDANLKHLIELPALNKLDLSSTQIHDAGLVHVGRLTNLISLDIFCRNISDAGITNLSGLTRLQSLTTQVDSNAEELRNLKARLPNLHVNDISVLSFSLGVVR